MQKISFSLLILLACAANAFSKEKLLSKKEYVEQWRSVAIQQMVKYKIPASITLAQATLESGCGNGELARKGNNHFGIKCHDWKGATILIDDNKENECFRAYASAEESFEDHSLFLTTKKRYAGLFAYPLTDYSAWAKGLKEAGYATNPSYASLLVNLIEELKLYELDGAPAPQKAPEQLASTALLSNNEAKHTVNIHENKVNYIVTKRGDTFFRIAQEFGLGLWQLYRYNDFASNQDLLNEGSIVYIQPKRKRAKHEKEFLLTQSLTMREVSQLKAVKLEALMKKNKCTSADEQLPKGTAVVLK